MSYSLDFCKRRYKECSCEENKTLNFDNAIEIPSEPYFDKVLNGIRKFQVSATGTVDGQKKDIEYDVSLYFNPLKSGCDYGYYASTTFKHDGTLSHIVNGIYDIVQRVITAATYDTNRGRPVESSCVFYYQIGNFIIVDEFDDDGTKFTPPDKPWMRSRTTIMLPLAYHWDSKWEDGTVCFREDQWGHQYDWVKERGLE